MNIMNFIVLLAVVVTLPSQILRSLLGSSSNNRKQNYLDFCIRAKEYITKFYLLLRTTYRFYKQPLLK
jgi:hypothetical protein